MVTPFSHEEMEALGQKDVMSWDLDQSLYLELELHGLMLLRGMGPAS